MTQPATPTPEQIAREAVLYCRHTAGRKGFESGACFDCIASALSSATPRWIPVSERLPLFAQIPFGASDDVIWAIIRGGKIEEWGKGNVSSYGEWCRAGIKLNWIPTHWMPLPTAPKGDTPHV